MNRTKEFIRIVESTNIPQKQTKGLDSDLKALFNLDSVIRNEIDVLQDIVNKNRVYEGFRIQQKLEEVRERISKLKKMLDFDIPSNNKQEFEFFSNLTNILRTRANKYVLKLNELSRKRGEKQTRKHVAVEEEKEPSIIRTEQHSLDAVSLELQEEQTFNVRFRDREAITNQISEIGEIMEEIGIHVAMQEESFKRIDELMVQTDGVFDTSIYLLRKTLTNIKGVRSTIIKFFLFWLVVAFIFWLLRFTSK